jgi:hypothetical protein
MNQKMGTGRKYARGRVRRKWLCLGTGKRGIQKRMGEIFGVLNEGANHG